MNAQNNELQKTCKTRKEVNMKQIITLTITIILIVLVSCAAPQTHPAVTPGADIAPANTPKADMPNLASVFCQEQGFQSEIRTAEAWHLK